MPANYAKLCVECTHCKPDHMQPDRYACHATRDLVTGAAPSVRPSARGMRAKSGACGPHGRLYVNNRHDEKVVNINQSRKARA